MANYVLASVGDVQLFNQTSGELIVTSKTLTDSGINFSVTEEEIRGGLGNAKISSYFHDSAMGLTLTDALFNLQYLALNVGGEITASADVLTLETDVAVVVANKITVSETPRMFGTVGTIGWYTEAGKDEWKKIVFNPETKTADVEGLTAGTKVCVKYIKTDNAADQFKVSSAFIPSQVYAILTLPLFKAGVGGNGDQLSSSSKVGEIQVEIPNFMLAGAQDLSLTASGAATTSLSGSALVSNDGASCDDTGFYARIKQIVFGKDEWADVKAIVVSNSNIELEAAETETLEVYALYSGVKAPRLIENAKLTFTSSDDTIATVAGGVITAVATGHADIEVLAKNDAGETLFSAMAVVEVA